MLTPLAQEVSERNCNVGWEREELRQKLRACFQEEEGVEIGEWFDAGRLEMEEVEEGWNSKVGWFSIYSSLSLLP